MTQNKGHELEGLKILSSCEVITNAEPVSDTQPALLPLTVCLISVGKRIFMPLISCLTSVDYVALLKTYTKDPTCMSVEDLKYVWLNHFSRYTLTLR